LLFRVAVEAAFAARFLILWARVFISTPMFRPANQIWNCILIAFSRRLSRSTVPVGSISATD